MSDLAERSVIGALLMDITVIHKVYDTVKPEMFSDALLGEIYKEIRKGYDIGQTVNVVTISQALESQTFSRERIGQELKGCIDTTIMTSQIGSYADSIVKDYKARTLRGILAGVNISPVAIEEQITELIQGLEELKSSERDKAKKLTAIVDLYREQYFKEREQSKLYTGFPKLDDITGGLEGGDVIVIGARPAVGKSAFVSQIILQMGRSGKRVGFYNLEMSDQQVYERLLSNESGIRLNRIRRAVTFLGGEKERFESANKTLVDLDILISSGAKSISEIRNECRHQELDCIIIDYLQLVKADVRYQSRASEVGAISKAIKALAMELKVPIIALSQLNRVSEMRDDKEPTMGELREAGDIEQDASIIMLLWNLGKDDNTRKGLKVDKNRQGECGKIVYCFDGNEMRFVETDEDVKQSGDGFKRTNRTTPFD